MAKKMMSQPGLVEEFIKIVDSFGGEECRNWAHVARILFNACQFQVKSPQKLKRIYESFKIPKQELSNYQFSKLLEIDIKCRGNHITATKDFFNETGVRMSQCRFKEHAVLGIRNTLKVLVKILGTQKKTIQSALSRFSYTSIQIMFRAADCKDQDDVLIQEIKKYAKLFEQAYLIYAENHFKSQPDLFDLLKPIMNRQYFRRGLFYLFFIDELKSISLKQIQDDNDLKNHPLLQKTIEQNKKLPFYQKVVNLCDREEKYNMYCSYNNNDDQFFKIYLDESQLKKRQALQIKKQNENLKTVRGKIHQPGDQQFRGWKTVVFQPDEDIMTIDKDGHLKQELKRKRMQELYEVAFGEDNN